MKNKKNNGEHDVSCSDCGFLNCYRQEKSFPEFCPGETVEPGVLESVTREYCGDADDARIFSKILRRNGFEPYSVLCKIGSVDKGRMGLDDNLKIRPGTFEGMCNPILQARLLDKWGADLNVIIGLCVGHDALFSKHSEALVTTLVVKDRVLAHNPAAALYTSKSYYNRVMEEGRQRA